MFNDIHLEINNNQWEIKKIWTLLLTKENSPLIFEKIKVPLPNDTLFADLAVKRKAFPEFVELKKGSIFAPNMLTPLPFRTARSG
jgi:predicted nucleotidyltransferase